MRIDRKEREIRKLWKSAFNDDDSFVRFYFKHVYRDENALVIEDGGRIVSSLQLLPYRMMYFGREISAAYIAGACTVEEERGRGRMGLLMEKAFEEMRVRGVLVATLIPADAGLFGYYGRFGFTNAFDYSLGMYVADREPSPDYCVKVVKGKAAPDVYDYFDSRLRQRQVGMLHSCDDLGNIMKDMELAYGHLFVAYRGGAVCGMAFVVPGNPYASREEIALLAKEALYDNEEAGRSLLHYISGYYGVGRIVYRMPSVPSRPSQSYGMARVMDAGRMIDLWLESHPGARIGKKELLGMDAGGLTSIVLDYGNRTAYMSLMLD
jgi:predicted N-acetyltransferase YhbS